MALVSSIFSGIVVSDFMGLTPGIVTCLDSKRPANQEIFCFNNQSTWLSFSQRPKKKPVFNDSALFKMKASRQ